jgi:hypothetical protein
MTPKLPALAGTFSFALFSVLGWTGIQTPGCRIAVNQFDHRHRRAVAIPETGFENPCITAVAFAIACAQYVKQFLHLVFVTNFRHGLTASMHVTTLGQRNQLLSNRPQILGLGQRCNNLLMLDQRSRHIGKHCLAMRACAVELASALSVAHWPSPWILTSGAASRLSPLNFN